MKLILTILILFLSSGVQPVHSQGFDNLVILANQQRAIYKERPLYEDYRLDRVAQTKACDMYNNHYWSHYDLQGRAPWHLYYENGYYFRWAGETLARDYFTDQAVINAWMASPTHRAIILDYRPRAMGVGRCGDIVAAEYGS